MVHGEDRTATMPMLQATGRTTSSTQLLGIEFSVAFNKPRNNILVEIRFKGSDQYGSVKDSYSLRQAGEAGVAGEVGGEKKA